MHIQDIMDFLACPQLYIYRKSDLDPSTGARGRINPNTIREQYDKALHKSIAFLFHSVQNGYYPSLAELKQKWGYLWVKPRMEKEDVRFRSTSWRDVHEIKRKQGWEKLQRVWEHFRENPGTPILIDYDYSIPFNGTTLEGTIDLVRVVKNEAGREYVELIEFITDERYAPFVHIRRDWRVTAAAAAFRKMIQVNVEKIVYHGIISGRLTETTRDENDERRLFDLMRQVTTALEHDIHYPVFSERCLTCPYEILCEKG
jgi:hypothetical protein